MKNIIEFLKSLSGVRVCTGISCKNLTTFKIGGDCTAVFPDSESSLVTVIHALKEYNIKSCILGNGSNVVFSDEGYDGIVVVTTDIKSISVNDNRIYASCGVPLHVLCNTAADNSLSGLQFAYGIPGTVGGAVFMNAGAYDGEIKDVVSSVRCYNTLTDETLTLKTDECGFSYRYSDFQNNGLVILGAEFILQQGIKEDIKSEMNGIILKRKEKQPLNYPSAGSAFKRYPGKYTAKMIDEAGLKGFACGGAQVSVKHAGFIVNTGNATCGDVEALVDIIKKKIEDREGIQIECEIRFVK